ncbi:catalase [Xylanimonas sp. McL0601]|uniref:catalase n=1 Tax=Xylanimonas sp. McL0601 TaxID=3414739 RepID=UPI003CF52759
MADRSSTPRDPSGTPRLTTAGGVPVADTDHSLKAGTRGPSLLQDHHLREKITHFDHERIPERVVHARGAGAHGRFESYGTASLLTCAQFLQPDVVTPVFVRFSTVVGSRGSADTVRDTRGFATKLYTAEGTFDLVGNSMPVFFVQDAIKFPDVVHAVKPQPDLEIPQAQSAHDTFWDFVSLHTEAQHHTIWLMSDRGIPRSYRTMEGFGVHTFRLVAADGSTSLVKWHWKPKAGVHSLVWEEAQLAAGLDPDFHRRDLAQAIDAGAYPEWELGVQVFPDSAEQQFEGIDLLDPTKLVPEELAPVHAVGRLTLDANPRNYFAETEQVAFDVGNLVRGIDLTDDPLLQGRLFSYLDTQLTRLGGPNFTQLPVNRPHAPVDDLLRDGMHQTEVHEGVAYLPSSVGGGCPVHAGGGSAFIEVSVPVDDDGVAPVKARRAPASFADHFSQPRLFWRSLSAIEQAHTAAAYTFELGRCTHPEVQERQLQALANIDPGLCATVAAGLGLPAPAPTVVLRDTPKSRALSQLGHSWPVAGRVVGVVADGATSTAQLDRVHGLLLERGVRPLVLAPTGGWVADGVSAHRSWLTAASVEVDALMLLTGANLAPGADPTADARAAGRTDAGSIDGVQVDPRVVALVDQAFRHAKAIATVPDGVAVLAAAGAEAWAAGITTADDAVALVEAVVSALAGHRVWERFTAGRR